jgi:hypothetical protein
VHGLDQLRSEGPGVTRQPYVDETRASTQH